ncbi:Imm26 family immunity protein [Mesorhizobium sp. 43Arga]
MIGGSKLAKRLPYREGSVFRIPLPDGGFARGVVARMAPRGRILLGYFFGPRMFSADTNASDLLPTEAVVVGRFGDLHLIDGKWEVFGEIGGWNRTYWPIPEFIHHDLLRIMPDMIVRYSDDDIVRGTRERRSVLPAGLAEDGLMGAEFVEIRLSGLLAEKRDAGG